MIGKAKSIDAVEAQGINVNRIVKSLSHVLPIERLYLFGSRARGDFRDDSDVDLYATVKMKPGESWLQSSAKARGALSWMPFSKDVLVMDEDAFDGKALQVGTLEYTVKNEGVLLHGRA